MRIRFRAPPAALLVAAAVFACAPPAAAQPTRDLQAPTVTIDPFTFTSDVPTVTVTITWQDNKQLAPTSRSITLNGATVTSSFNYNGDTKLATSTATITLVPGTNTLTASIRDASNNLGTATVGYGYTPPDTTAPTVSISPGTSSTSSGSLAVTINWADDRLLSSETRSITLNGASVTDAFSYSGSATSATSTGTISLVPGTNTLTASVEDLAGNVGTQTVTYTYTPPDTNAPTVSISPATSSTGSGSLAVTVNWADDRSLSSGTRTITLNGASVTGAFTYSGSATSASSTGTISLVPGANTLTASIQDAAGNTGTQTVTYTYTPPDTNAPTVSISPGTSSTGSGSLAVTVNWADDRSLSSGTRSITLNGASVTSAFGYSGSATSATSTGTISLVPGANTLTASIQDAAGNTGTQTVTYTYTPPDTNAPTVSISPATSSTNSGSLAVTVSWADDQSLSSGTRSITLNGASVTGSFGYSGSATSASSTGTISLVPGANTLTASIQDAAGNTGTQTVTYTYTPPTQSGAPIVDVASVNPGVTPERSLCVTASTGPGSAYECGDLRIVHALQTVRLAGRARTPALLYNSQFAQPFPVVAAKVSLPAGASAPTQIEAKVSVNGVVRATRQWDGAAWADGRARRIALGWSALQDPTGLYPYTLEVTAWYGTTPYTTTVTGNVVVVNRSTSQYGVGWWIAGLEQLYFPADTTTRLWVGGDGSARLYRKVAADRWVADAVDRPDTLTWTGTEYARLLPAGARVYFRTDGRHTRTVNRLGWTTTFAWQAPAGGLGPYISSIVLPYSKEAQRITHSIVYPIANNSRMSWIEDEVQRQVNFTYGLNDSRITAMTDPDGTVVRFTYGDAANPNRITAVTNVLGTTTSYGYDAAGKLSQASIALPAGAMATAFEAAESRGWSTPADSAAAYAQIDGPRTDVPDRTRMWVNRFGAPEVLENAMGHRTTVTHGDARWPALATEVRAPNGLLSRAGYDARGNLLADTVVNPLGDGRNAVTRYEYGDARWPDFVTRATLPQGEVTEMGYDSLGNRIWQQDGRGVSSRVEFRYYTAWPGDGQVRAVDGPSTAPDSVVYDRYGNVTAVKTPMGFWSYTYRDLMGRDTLTRTPIDSAQTAYQTQRTTYDAMDRVLETRTWALQYVPGPGEPAPPYDSVVVRNYYDRGLPYRTDRRVSPDRNAVGTLVTRTEFDGLGRVVRQHGVDATPADSLDDPVDRTFYALSGLVDSVTSRRGYTTRVEYDTLGRVRRRYVPAVDVAQNGNVPLYSDDPAGGVHIPADTVVFAYDTMGNVLQADNHDAHIARRYYPNGKLRTDTLRIRTWTGADFDRHAYGLSYTWDLDGRPLTVQHPQQLAYSYANGQVQGFESHFFQWDPVTGFLHSDGVSTFDYDAEGRLIRDGNETFAYDDDSRLVRRIETGTSSPPGPLGQYTHDDHYGYDARGKPVRLLATMDSITNEYSGLGMIIRNHRQPLEVTSLACDPATGGVDCYVRHTGEHTIDLDNTFQYDMDALGNEVSNRNVNLSGWTGYADHYQAGTGRQTSRDVLQNNATVSQDQSTYDAAGNQTYSLQNVLRRSLLSDGSHMDAWTQDASYYWYGADNRLRVVDKRSTASADCCGMDYPATFQEYRFDALGRRVALRSRNALTGVDVIQRFVWDGDDLLAETRYPVQPMTDWMGVTHNWAEADTETVRIPLSCEQSHNCGEDTTYYRYYRDYGRVLYLHGRAMDMPRVITRVGWVPDSASVIPDYRQPLGPVVVMPRRNWQGASDGGEFTSWQVLADGSVVSPGNAELSSVSGIGWPGPDISPYRVKSRGTSNGSWWGSMMDDHRDGSGLLYMRNRFYDPLAGRFTQEDPIGLAGGLNAYGFANGDPVSFSDPYGLCPYGPCEGDDTNPRKAEAEAQFAHKSDARAAAAATVFLAVFAGPELLEAADLLLTAGTAASPWALPAVERGLVIEEDLGGNLPPNFPTIDRFANGVATSIKSVDVTLPSYQNGSALLSRLNEYTRALASFNGARLSGVVVRGSEITQRVLNVAIPAGRLSPAQQTAVSTAQAYASQRGVQLIITPVR